MKNYTIILSALLTAMMWSCSTTRRIPNDEILYTGLKGVKVNTPDPKETFPSGVHESLTEAVSVKPNNVRFGIGAHTVPHRTVGLQQLA